MDYIYIFFSLNKLIFSWINSIHLSFCMNKFSCSLLLAFSLKSFRFLTSGPSWPFPSFSSSFRRRFSSVYVISQAHQCLWHPFVLQQICFRTSFFPHDYQSSNHLILPAWFPSIRRFRIFLWAPPIIIPSIIFYMVIYYLDIDRSMLFLSLRSLLTPSRGHCFPRLPPFPCFFFPSILQNTRLVV